MMDWRNNFFSITFFDTTSKKTNIAQHIAFFLLAISLFAYKILFHELWKDEWQAWFIARDMSLPKMFSFLYYEGHPSLWYIYLKIHTFLHANILSFVSEDVYFQAAHTIIIAIVFYFIIYKFRLTWLGRVFFLCNFFILFEYGIVNRGYVFFVLLSFLAIYLFSKPTLRILPFCIVIFLLCQAEVQGVIFACSLFFYQLLEKKQASIKDKNLQFQLGTLIFGIVCFLLTTYNTNQHLNDAFKTQKLSSSDAFLTSFQGLFANTFLIGWLPNTNIEGVQTVGILLSLLVLAAIIYLFFTDKKILLGYLSFAFVFQFFCSFFYVGGVRQWGTIFIVFLAYFYLYLSKKNLINGIKTLILSLLFASQIIYTATAFYKDYIYPFSNAKKTAAFLKQQNIPAQVPIVAINPFATSVLNGYLDRKLHTLPSGETFTYFEWLSKIYYPTEQELRLFAQFKKVKGLVIVTAKPLDAQRYPSAKLQARFDDFNLKNENFYVYLFQ
jgi:hypothetical protein